MKRRSARASKARIFQFEPCELRVLLSDVSLAVIGKGVNFTQAGTAAPTLVASTPYSLTAMLNETSNSTVSSASVTPPGMSALPLTAQSEQNLILNDNFDTQGALDAAFPSGSYQFAIDAVNDGEHTLNFSVPSDNFAAAPYISDFAAVNDANASQAITVTWNPMSNGTSSDYMIFHVYGPDGNVIRTPTPGSEGALTGTATQYTIPAGMLEPGVQYSLSLSFIKFASTDTTDYPGVFNAAYFESDTSLNFGTETTAPVGLAATGGTLPRHVGITWDTVSGAASYQVFRGTSSNSETKIAAGLTSPGFSDLSAVPGVVYYYSVRAVGPGGVGPMSGTVTGYRPLAAPTGLAASEGTLPRHVSITWSAVPGAASYQVFRGTTSSGAENKIAGGITATGYNDLSAVPGVVYYYSVRAVNSTGIGLLSAPVTGFEPLPAPANPSASDNVSGEVDLSWNSVSGADAYQVFRSTTDDFATADKIATNVFVTTFDDMTATPDQVYFYWIRARNPGDIGVPSAPVTGEAT